MAIEEGCVCRHAEIETALQGLEEKAGTQVCVHMCKEDAVANNINIISPTLLFVCTITVSSNLILYHNEDGLAKTFATCIASTYTCNVYYRE